MLEVSSLQNPVVKKIRSVATRKGREREGSFWAEGIHITLEALETGWPVERLVWCPDLLTSERARKAVESADIDKVTVNEVVFRKVSGRENPSGLGALLKTVRRSLGALTVGAESYVLLLDRPRDPGNLGTIIRTAASAGVDALVIVGSSTDPYDPRSVRAAMGALFALPVVTEGKVEGFLAWADDHGLRLVGSSAKGDVDYRDADYTRPIAMLLGSEQHGLDEELVSAAHVNVRIPMIGRASSLNLAAAAAVLAFAVADDRRGTR